MYLLRTLFANKRYNNNNNNNNNMCSGLSERMAYGPWWSKLFRRGYRCLKCRFQKEISVKLVEDRYTVYDVRHIHCLW